MGRFKFKENMRFASVSCYSKVPCEKIVAPLLGNRTHKLQLSIYKTIKKYPVEETDDSFILEGHSLDEVDYIASHGGKPSSELDPFTDE